MKFAYADPPYLGCAKRLYGDATYDSLSAHKDLIERLETEFPDGWAMSLHTPSLGQILPLCPTRSRVGAWVKPFASFKPGVNPAYTWEPVVFVGGRKRERMEPTVRDFVSANITLKKGLTGAKPPEFCRWILSLLNVRPEDDLVDLFPGTNSMLAVREQIAQEVDGSLF